MVNMWIKKTQTEIRLGYSDMFYIRDEIAHLYDKEKSLNGEFSRLYHRQLEGITEGSDWWKQYNEELNNMEKEKNLSPKLLDFLYASDCEGKVTYGTCGIVYKLLQKSELDAKFGFYNLSVYDLMLFFKEAYDNKSGVEWC